MSEINIEKLRKMESEAFSVFWNSIDVFDEFKKKIEDMQLRELYAEAFICSEEKTDEKISYHVTLKDGKIVIKKVEEKVSYMEPTTLMKLLAIKERALERLLKIIFIKLEQKVDDRTEELKKLKEALSEKEEKSEQK
jgi:hypothetical protein